MRLWVSRKLCFSCLFIGPLQQGKEGSWPYYCQWGRKFRPPIQPPLILKVRRASHYWQVEVGVPAFIRPPLPEAGRGRNASLLLKWPLLTSLGWLPYLWCKSRLPIWPLLVQWGPQFLLEQSNDCLKVFCPARLPFPGLLARESWLLLGFLCLCHWYFQLVSFFSSKSGTHEAKGKPRNSFPTVLGLPVPAGVPSLSESPHVCSV